MKYFKLSVLVFFLFVLGQVYSFAQDKVKGIIVELSSGKKVEYRLDDHPKLVFNGQTINLTADGVQVEYTPLELMKVTMGEVTNVNSGIDEHLSVQNGIMVESGFVRLTGFNATEVVAVYSTNGIKRADYFVGGDGSLVIPISSLPIGISIIRTKEQSIKITRQ